MNENDLLDMKHYIDKLRQVLPVDKLDSLAKEATKWYDTIRKEKPKQTVSNTVMQRIYKELHIPANQIDDFCLKNGIGDEQALNDYLKLLEKNKTNKPIVDGEGKNLVN